MAVPRIQDFVLQGRHVLVRVDFNVPIGARGMIADDTRIQEALATIRHICRQEGRVILMSHLGKPQGRADSRLSLRPCAKHLSELLQQQVQFSPACIGPEAKIIAQRLQPGEVMLLENLRFHPGEEQPVADPFFVKQLAELGDFYVNDAFGTAHRAHASTTEIATLFPGKRAAGLLLQKEMDALDTILLLPKRPLFAILGGAKVSAKLPVLKSLLGKVDGIFLGGGMTYTFLAAQEISCGDSPVEHALVAEAKLFLRSAREQGVPLYLPIDIVIANRFDNDADTRIVSAQEGVPRQWQGMDIGPASLKQWFGALQGAGTIFWNGPIGVCELPRFSAGTRALAEFVSGQPANTLIGGGDSVAAIKGFGILDRFTHVSTGGGAALEYLELGTLPGIQALEESHGKE